MVSLRDFSKYVPQQLVFPNSKYVLTSKFNDNSYKRTVKDSPVIYDCKSHGFVLKKRGKTVPINDESDFKVERISFSIPIQALDKRYSEIFSESDKTETLYLNLNNSTWFNSSFLAVPSSMQDKLSNYFVELFNQQISEYNKEKNRKVKKEKITKFSRYFVNHILNKGLESKLTP
jgi:hypothetical protein